MPIARRLDPAEFQKAAPSVENIRAKINAEYDALLADYGIGEYVGIELAEDDNKATVRNRLNASAERRGWKLRFIRTTGEAIRFEIEQGELPLNGQVEEELVEV